MATPFSQAELTRYSRQLLLGEVGLKGQDVLRNTRVLCIGAGGLGSPALLYLAAAGVGRLGIIDSDVVDESNLQRQVLYRSADIGKRKAELAAEQLRRLNPGVQAEPHCVRFSEHNALELISGYDIILDCSDNFATRFLVNDAAVKSGKPVVYGSVSELEGRLSVFWAERGPCYRCFHPKPQKAPPSSAALGIMGAVAGTIGSLQAMEALKLALAPQAVDALRPAIGKMLVVDFASLSTHSFEIAKKPGCEVCSKARHEIVLTSSFES